MGVETWVSLIMQIRVRTVLRYGGDVGEGFEEAMVYLFGI